MLTKEQLKDIVDQCSYEDWLIQLRYDGDRPYLQVRVNGRDNVTGKPLEWTGRKWMLSYHMCKQEVVRTAFKAVLTAMQHEVEELFKYRGVAIYNPHLDPDALVDFVKDAQHIQERANVEFAA